MGAWVREKSQYGAWSWVGEVIQNRCRTLARAAGVACVNPEAIAAAVEASRRDGVEEIRAGEDWASNAKLTADWWRDGVGPLADLILRAAGVPGA
jgi:hypothetical protein